VKFVAKSAKFHVQLNAFLKAWYPYKGKTYNGPIYTMVRDHDDGGAQNTSKGDPMKI
jgi:hypothetical protein